VEDASQEAPAEVEGAHVAPHQRCEVGEEAGGAGEEEVSFAGVAQDTMTPEQTRCVMTQIVMPMHTNGMAGVMFGGVMMQWIDVCAGVAAMRLAGGPVVTASIDRLDFLSPVHAGEIVVLHAQVNSAARTSMEVGCRVETEDMVTRTRRYVTKAYLTFVATDEHGRPRRSGALTLELATDDDRRRHAEAEARRADRLQHRLRRESAR
jgi:acyl-CoA hydrolase